MLLLAVSTSALAWKASDTEQALPAANAYAAGDYATAAEQIAAAQTLAAKCTINQYLGC